MPFAAINAVRVLIACSLILILSAIDTTAFSHAFLEFLFIGRVPGTSIFVGFEAFFAGIVFFAWAIATYGFAIRGFYVVHEKLSELGTQSQDLEEIAL